MNIGRLYTTAGTPLGSSAVHLKADAGACHSPENRPSPSVTGWPVPAGHFPVRWIAYLRCHPVALKPRTPTHLCRTGWIWGELAAHSS